MREKAKGQDLLSLFRSLNSALKAQVLEAATTIIPPPPIQGIGNSGGFTLMVELRDGSGDFVKLQSVADQIVANAASQSAIQTVFTSFRASTPQLYLAIDRNKAETLGVTVGQVFSALRKLCRLELRHPVQQVRAGVPGLRAGGIASSGCSPTTSAT